MEDQNQPPQSIVDQLKEYAELRIKLLKYKAIDGGSSGIAVAVVGTVIVLVALFLIVFISITLGFFLSDVLNSYWKGFGCVALTYLLKVVILLLARNSIKQAIANTVVKKFFNE